MVGEVEAGVSVEVRDWGVGFGDLGNGMEMEVGMGMWNGG